MPPKKIIKLLAKTDKPEKLVKPIAVDSDDVDVDGAASTDAAGTAAGADAAADTDADADAGTGTGTGTDPGADDADDEWVPPLLPILTFASTDTFAASEGAFLLPSLAPMLTSSPVI